MKQLIEKLVAIQSELKAPKGQTNNFGKYKYRSCEDILEAVKPLLKKEGLFLSITDEIENVGDRYYIKAVAIVTDGVDRWQTQALAREEETKKGMDASQISGSASSYARKYALNGMFAIDDTKDSDATNTGDSLIDANIPKLDNVEFALYEVKLAKSQDGLKTIWSKHLAHQKNELFLEAIKTKKAELNG
jgi:hypothetical protein